jgi:alpha-ketoglutarate-dependent taurine dioxygenase
MLTEKNAVLVQTELTPRIGTALQADVGALLSGAFASEIRTILEQRGVVLFPKLNLTDEEQITFTECLGRVTDKNVFKISMDPRENPVFEYTKGAFYWHIDGTMSDVPIFASVMSGRCLAAEGGETEFSNTYAAWDDLPGSEQRALEHLKVVHMFEVSQRYVKPEPSWAELQAWQKFQPNTLPLVWTHRSGRKSLVLGSTASHIEGMGLREGWAVLTRLRDYATQPQFVYRHEWSVGDMLIWDNTGTMHRALPYAMDSGRLMHRTTVQGEEPFA